MRKSEEWRRVSWAPDYEVSSKGRVRSYKRRVPYIMTPSPDDYGYLKLDLYVNGKPRSRTIHRLVAEEFIPNPDGKPQVAHGNGVQTDNAVENLRWASNSENQGDRVVHGTDGRGEKNPAARLTAPLVREIRQKYEDSTTTHREIAAAYGVDRSTITMLMSRKTWRYV